jgi:hypothetical protein
MNWWVAWPGFVLAVLVLVWTGYHFSLRTLRVVTAVAALAAVAAIPWYGLTLKRAAPGGFSGSFARGADAIGVSFFHARPGEVGWIVIVVAFVIGYRELEVWALRNQARSLDTSALARSRPDADGGEPRDDDMSDKQRYDRLAPELKFRLPAVEVRSPAILPGGSRTSGLASIAEASGFAAGGLAGAIIKLFGMLWPGARRLRVHVWVERTPGRTGIDDVTRVTVDLDDPRTGLSLATKTLAAGSLDAAASAVAGYVARHIFAEDRTAPPWCTGAADGRDLAALLLARQVRDYPESEELVGQARATQIQILESVAHGKQCAGVARYELAQLYDLTGRHVEALLVHAVNRAQYPHFYRGRYRLAMSLEMIASAEPGVAIRAAEVPRFNEALRNLRRCGVLPADLPDLKLADLDPAGDGVTGLPPGLRAGLLDAAGDELRAIRRYLSLPNVVLRSFWRRDERGILKPYLRQPYRQSFHDGVGAALLLVAVRRAHIAPGPDEPAGRRPDRARTTIRIAAAITGNGSALARAVGMPADGGLEHGPPPLTKSLRTRHLFRPYRTRSWQASYNLACAYAAVAQVRQAAGADAGELRDLAGRVVGSLEFTVCSPECELDRPWDWISNDPDFGCLHSSDEKAFAEFREFLTAQKRRDYPPVPAVPAVPAVPDPARVKRRPQSRTRSSSSGGETTSNSAPTPPSSSIGHSS